MKRIALLVVGTVLALGAQGAWSEQVAQASTTAGSTAEPRVSISTDRVGGQYSVNTMFDALGITGNGPFPSRGGPIDD